MITIGVAAETDAAEKRVALSPETAKKLTGKGCAVVVQSGAGAGSNFSDAAFEEAGAKVAGSAQEAVGHADIVLTVRRPPLDLASQLKPGAIVVGMLDPHAGADALKPLAGTGLTLFAMEYLPRITRAQGMDVLSSQANLAGYKAVIDAAAAFGRAMPMMMTAAGTVPAAKAFIMGAGVAGLQAIATARRLGAAVSATDVRPVAKEQVASLGAKFIAVDNEEFRQAETSGGYAKEMSDDYKRQQAELVAEHLKSQDIVITTALIPGRPAPELISQAMVDSMKPGSVIVDLAAERGGNCAVTKPGETVTRNGVMVMGRLNLPGDIPGNASALYAKNLMAFIDLMITEDAERPQIDWDDDIIKGTAVARDGELVHPNLTGEGAA